MMKKSIYCKKLNNWCPSCFEGGCFCKGGVPVLFDFPDIEDENHE
jgi:hypothetical protein